MSVRDRTRLRHDLEDMLRVLNTLYAPFLATAEMEMDREKDGATR
jgi:hypothetical protein